jgi:hypothetical protein
MLAQVCSVDLQQRVLASFIDDFVTIVRYTRCRILYASMGRKNNIKMPWYQLLQMVDEIALNIIP